MKSADAATLLTMMDAYFLLCGEIKETKKNPAAMNALANMTGIPEEHSLDIRPTALDPGCAFPETEEFRMRTAKQKRMKLHSSGITDIPLNVRTSSVSPCREPSGGTDEINGWRIPFTFPVF